MGDLLSLAWRPEASPSTWRPILTAAGAAGFKPLRVGETHWLAAAGPRPPAMIRLTERLTVVGDLFESLDPVDPPPEPQDDDLAWARWLGAARWGRYLALFQDERGRVRRLFRDPSGALEGLSWTHAGVQIVSTGTPDWLMRTAPGDIAIDWDRVPDLATDPLAALDAPALVGLRAAGAGDLIDLDAAGRSHPIWRPGDFVRHPRRGSREAAALLRTRLDACVSAWGALDVPFGAEVSGGLDSALVAGALVQARAPTRFWLNTYADLPETDERAFAASLGAKLGFEPDTIERRPGLLSEAGFQQTAGGPRPGLNGRDAGFDALVADHCRQAGVTALMTGKGGDAVFFHSHTQAAYHDLALARPHTAWASPYLADVARWTRTSVWSVLAAARRSNACPAPPTVLGRHAWMEELDDLGAGKQQQVAAVTAGLAFQTPCRRTEAADLIHPLLSQPLVELCLSIPTPILTEGGRDRALARRVFADRLPASIRERRVKGDYTAWFNREAAASLPFLREHLLEGRLAQKGVIDPGALEPCLDRDHLQWRGGSGLLVNLAMVESWVRRWEGRRVAA